MRALICDNPNAHIYDRPRIISRDDTEAVVLCADVRVTQQAKPAVLVAPLCFFQMNEIQDDAKTFCSWRCAEGHIEKAFRGMIAPEETESADAKKEA